MDAKDKEEFRELFLDAFEPFATSIQQSFLHLEGRIDGLERSLMRLERRMDNMDSTIAEIRMDIRKSV